MQLMGWMSLSPLHSNDVDFLSQGKQPLGYRNVLDCPTPK